MSDEPWNILKSAWIYYDRNGERIAVSSEDVSEALASGEFYHPYSGESVPDFRETIGLLYQGADELDQVIEGGQKKVRRRATVVPRLLDKCSTSYPASRNLTSWRD
jgi:hypothetical protein